MQVRAWLLLHLVVVAHVRSRLLPFPPVSLLSPAPRGALAVRALHATLHNRIGVERAVRYALREGTTAKHLTNSDERAAVASAVFGTSTLRARLSRLLAGAPPSDLRARAGDELVTPDARRWLKSAQMLVLFLLHEEPQRVSREAMSAALPPDAIGLSEASLRALEALNWDQIDWPKDPIVSFAVRHSLPYTLARKWIAMLGTNGNSEKLGAIMSLPGPVILRTNLAVSTRDKLMEQLRLQGVQCRKGSLSPWAVVLEGGSRNAWKGSVWSLAGWKEGAFELQDEGSQCVALACEVGIGETVLDLCAGNGGKSLALAALIGPQGQLLAHDVVPSRLAALRASSVRAHVADRISTVASPAASGKEGAGELAVLSRSVAPQGHDLVLVDAPCSSSGALRRRPELRWGRRAGEGHSARLLPELQLQLLQQGLSFTRLGGRLVYATCALDLNENEGVADAFEQAAIGQIEPWPFTDTTPGRHEKKPHYQTLWPHMHPPASPDGFFIARWRVRKAPN